MLHSAEHRLPHSSDQTTQISHVHVEEFRIRRNSQQSSSQPDYFSSQHAYQNINSLGDYIVNYASNNAILDLSIVQ